MVKIANSQSFMCDHFSSGLKLKRFAICTNVIDNNDTNHHTFNPRQINAGMFMNPNSIPDDPQRALLKGTRACNQLWKEQ